MSEKRIKNYCSNCSGITNHVVLHDKTEYHSSEEYHCQWTYSMVECLGCESISYRTVFDDLEGIHYEDDEHYRTISTYPISLQGHSSLKNTWNLPQQVGLVYKESLKAFANNCFLLTGVAFRAVIEAVCLDKGITGRTLETKINKLLSNKLITKKEAERLHAVRFLGNDAVHEMLSPEKDVLYLVLGIIEHLLNNLYLIDSEIEKNTKLEKVIADFHSFSRALIAKVRTKSVGEEFTINSLFGKDSRKIKEHRELFENTLLDKINRGEIDYLEVGRLESGSNSNGNKQHFKKTQ